MNRNKYTAYLLGLISVCASVSQISAGNHGSNSNKANKETYSDKKDNIVTWQAGSLWNGFIKCNLNRTTGHLKITAKSKNTEIKEIFTNYQQKLLKSEIKSVSFDGNITSIGYGTFKDCENLESVEMLPDSVKTIGASAFAGCKKLKSFTIPGSVEKIGFSAFIHCRNLKSIQILGRVKKIEKCTFAGSGLQSITIPNSITEIELSAFDHCPDLTSVEIPNSVEKIGFQAFMACKNLTTIEIPDSVKTIGINAFRDCTSLTYCKLPAEFKLIGYDNKIITGDERKKDLFYGCSSLTKKNFTF